MDGFMSASFGYRVLGLSPYVYEKARAGKRNCLDLINLSDAGGGAQLKKHIRKALTPYGIRKNSA